MQWWIALTIALFVSAHCGGICLAQDKPWAIWVMRPDGSQMRKVAQVDGCIDHSAPRWSHDGTRIAFSASPGGWSENSIYIVNTDSTGLRKVGPQARPDWSPDDKQLVYEASSPGRAEEVFVQDILGRGRTSISAGTSPRWSPDGSLLAISQETNVLVMDLVTGQTHSLFNSEQSHVFEGFSWSPDGTELAVVVRPSLGARRDLLFVNAAGENHGIRKRHEGGMGGHVSFSPDGKKLVYSNSLMIRIIDTQGTSRPRMLPGQKGKSKHPDWSPDGKWIAFASDRELP